MNADQDASLAENLRAVLTRMRAAEQRFGRPVDCTHLLAVSKRQPLEKIIAAQRAGQHAFGESYVQEAIDKQQELAEREPGLSLQWHFIGRIQSNKTRQIAEHFDWVHGLASIEHAQRLAAQRPTARGPLSVCVQVNLSGESSKAGVAPEQAAALFAELDRINGIRPQGLMTLPAPVDGFDAQRQPFAALRRLRDSLATPERPLPMLSMGMSADLEAAIAEGATMVRVGTAIFGERAPA
jgi:pyridoxal phosphate enzyme (YggS family)